MNPSRDHFASVPEAEWQQQEGARRRARDTGRQSHAGGGGPYDAIAAALRQPPPDALPDDFAATVARLATERAASHSPRSERTPMAVVGASFGLAGAVSLAVFADAPRLAVAGLLAGLEGPAGVWVVATASCLAVAWAGMHLLAHAGPTHSMR